MTLTGGLRGWGALKAWLNSASKDLTAIAGNGSLLALLAQLSAHHQSPPHMPGGPPAREERVLKCITEMPASGFSLCYNRE